MRPTLKYLVIFLWMVLAGESAYAAAPVKDWTLLLFINGNNNLHKSAEKNIRDMEKVGSNDRINVVVEWADKKSEETVRMLIEKSADPMTVTSPVLQRLSTYVDMGSYRALEDFIHWGVENFPAHHYFIAVWDHGAGWHGSQLPLKHHPKKALPIVNLNISLDDFTDNQITTEELGSAMKYASALIGHKVDIYASDACLMGMAEVAGEMSDSVDYYIGSEETEPDTGWPYDKLLKKWQAIPHADAKQISTILVDEYIKFQSKAGEKTVTMSAYDLNEFAALTKAIHDLAENIRGLDAAGKAEALKVIKAVGRFEFEDYGDLLDFMDKLSEANIPGLNPNSISAVQTAVRKVIIANKSVHPVNATGMSIWLPVHYHFYKFFAPHYSELQFDKDTQWGETLRDLLG